MIINEHIAPGSQITLEVAIDDVNKRLDVFLTQTLQLYSRSFFKRLIDDSHVTINQQRAKSSWALKSGDVVQVVFPPLPKPTVDIHAFDERLGISVVAQEADFLIVCKPAGLMVHKPNEHSTELTLVDWLLASYAELKQIGIEDRPGIIHRLDKNTSGLLIIPRTNEAFGLFGELFRTRKIEKLYWALVQKHPERCGTIEFPIGRDPVHKHRMAHLPKSGVSRQAFTSYKVIEYYPDYSLVEVRIITGRTHQIRVHFAAIGHSVLGDTVYGEPSLLIARQALHAKHIAFTYKGKRYEFDSPVAADMQKLIY